MPYKVVRSGDGWKVQGEDGKFHSEKPMSRRAATAQMRALYSNVPDARKESDAVVIEPKITTTKPVAERFLKFLGTLAHNAKIGHSAVFAMPLDGDGNEKFDVSGVDLPEVQETIPDTEQRVEVVKEVAGPATGINATGPGGLMGVMGLGGSTRSKKRWKRSKKSKDESLDLTPPKDVQEAAARGLEMRKKYGRGGLSTQEAGAQGIGSGVARASSLARGQAQNPKTVRRMAAFFDRHRKNRDSVQENGEPGNGKIAWALWGGDAGDRWSHAMVKRMDSDTKKSKKAHRWGKRKRDVAETVKEFFGTMSVFKDAKGDYRWVLFSSNAFRDRDREIIATKALENDVEESDETGEYGPLRWWHVDGLDLGDCDFRMVWGRTLIESGTFRTKEIGEAISKAFTKLQVSIGFRHPADQPDKDGVYTKIKTFERSILPAGRAANPFTQVFVERSSSMVSQKEKVAALAALGVDAKGILNQASQTEKELEKAGIAFKENESAQPAVEEDSAETEKAKKPAQEEAPKDSGDPKDPKSKTPQPKVNSKTPPAKPDPDDDDDTDTDEYDEEDVIGNMTLEEFEKFLGGVLEKALAPVAAKMHTHAAEEKKPEEKKAEEKKKEETPTPSSTPAAAQASASVVDPRIAAMESQISQLLAQVKELKEKSAEEPATPRAYAQGAGYMASNASDNILSEAAAKEIANIGPQAGDIQKTISDLMGFMPR